MAAEQPLECPRCRGSMEQGIIMDKQHYGLPGAPEWLEGPPERSIWTGLKMKGREVLSVLTYRCERCGYLESYARPKEGR